MDRVRQEEWLSFVKIFLQHCRDLVNTYDRSNLPRWLQSANIRYGVINDSLIAIFDDGDKGDTYSYLGNIDSDVVAIFKFENFIPFSTGINIPNNRGLVIFEGEVASNGGAVMQLRDEYPLFFDCGHHGRHAPMILCNLFFQYMPPSHSKSGPKSNQFIAFALYVHKSHIVDSTFFSTCDEQLIPHFTRTNLTLGPYYKKRQEIRQVFSVTVESTVIVLGKDSNETILNQMRELKVALASKGYQAVLVKELSEIPEWSNEQKVRAWAAAARFCVMIDDEPSGHDAEYIMLREQGVGLAVLRPRKRGSTWMIGSDKTEHIQIFEYDLSPLEVVEPAVVWAENLLATRRTRYNGTYPWRQEK